MNSLYVRANRFFFNIRYNEPQTNFSLYQMRILTCFEVTLFEVGLSKTKCGGVVMLMVSDSFTVTDIVRLC